MLVVLVLILGIVFSGIEMVDSAQQMRELYQQLDRVQRQQNELLAVHSRLLLERGARASLSEVENAAEQTLNMHFPPLALPPHGQLAPANKSGQ